MRHNALLVPSSERCAIINLSPNYHKESNNNPFIKPIKYCEGVSGRTATSSALAHIVEIRDDDNYFGLLDLKKVIYYLEYVFNGSVSQSENLKTE